MEKESQEDLYIRFKKMEGVAQIMNGFTRLKEMLNKWIEKHKNDEAFIQTVNYLLNRPDLEPKYLNEEKTLEGLNDFICYITPSIK